MQLGFFVSVFANKHMMSEIPATFCLKHLIQPCKGNAREGGKGGYEPLCFFLLCPKVGFLAPRQAYWPEVPRKPNREHRQKSLSQIYLTSDEASHQDIMPALRPIQQQTDFASYSTFLTRLLPFLKRELKEKFNPP